MELCGLAAIAVDHNRPVTGNDVRANGLRGRAGVPEVGVARSNDSRAEAEGIACINSFMCWFASDWNWMPNTWPIASLFWKALSSKLAKALNE